ncbi:MAG TPA: alpha/beta fold hydrolase [Solirubrobacterales bacterium]|nr:alpha/beta fold hydrolase [Solirubrobacterales bacterium]
MSEERLEPLLLLHGLGGSKEIWDPVLGLLEAERTPLAIDLPGFGATPPLAAQVEPSAANLAAAVHEHCLERGIERPHVAGNSLGGWVALEMGRTGWAASVTAISPAGLWRAPIGERPVNTRVWARRLRPLVSLALHNRRLRERALATFAAHPERIPAKAGRRLVLGWIDANGYDGANRAMRTHVFDPTDYPAIPVTLAWGELDRLVAPPRPERRPAGARFLTLPAVGHTPTWDDPELVAATLLQGSAVAVAG